MYNKVSPSASASTNPRDYHAIRAYGEWTHSAEYYIKQEQESACKQGQPTDVICEIVQPGGARTGKWRTVADIHNAHTKHAIETRIEILKRSGA